MKDKRKTIARIIAIIIVIAFLATSAGVLTAALSL